MFQAGGLPVVATCGTALTTAQAQLLRRFAAKAVLCYRPRLAPARPRPSEVRNCWSSEGFDVNVVRLPGGEDPDTFIQKHGPGRVSSSSSRHREPYLEYLLDRAAAEHDLTRDEAGVNSCARCSGVAARIPDPAARDQFADRLAHKARVTEEVVRAEIRKAAGAPEDRAAGRRACRRCMGHVREAPKKGLIWALIHDPDGGARLRSTAWKMMIWKDLALADLLLMARDLRWPRLKMCQMRLWSV